jgi:hypothetical protein
MELDDDAKSVVLTKLKLLKHSVLSERIMTPESLILTTLNRQIIIAIRATIRRKLDSRILEKKSFK